MWVSHVLVDEFRQLPRNRLRKALPPWPSPPPPLGTLVFWALMLLLLWPGFHQSLPGTLPPVPKIHKCFHCDRAPEIYSKVRTMPQAPFLFHIWGLSSRHIEIFRENGLSWFLFGWLVGFVLFCFVLLADVWCLHPRPKSLAESEWAWPGANLSNKRWPI